jgi:hypothetical protein
MEQSGEAHRYPPTSLHGVTVNDNVIIDNIRRRSVLPSRDSEISMARRLGVGSLGSDSVSIKYELFV